MAEVPKQRLGGTAVGGSDRQAAVPRHLKSEDQAGRLMHPAQFLCTAARPPRFSLSRVQDGRSTLRGSASTGRIRSRLIGLVTSA